MKYINLTPHTIQVFTDKAGSELITSFPPSGSILRLNVRTPEEYGYLGGVPVREFVPIRSGELQAPPPPEDGVMYIVSQFTLEGCIESGRTDFVSPDTSPAGCVRDRDGQIIGTTGFFMGYRP